MSVPLPRIAELDEPGDADLIAAVRSGDIDAYGVLYRRHAGSALALARQLAGSRSEADDLVAEAFAKVLDVLRGGGGPDTAFRAYLLTTLRNARYDRARRDRRLELSDDMTRHDPGVAWEDTAVAGLDSMLAARAFNRLPERWQTVLWHTEVEQESPAQVAPLLGLTPNGVAALAYRAREGLRQAYLQEHLANGVGREHRATVNQLGAWTRAGLSARQQARVDAHLAVCAECRALATELEDVNAGMRGVIAPLILGGGAAAYLAAHGGTAGVATAAAAAGHGVAAAGAAAGGAAGGGTAAGGSGGAAGGVAAAGGEAAVAAGSAAGATGSALGTVGAWVAGTHAGQAAAAAIAAVVIGGTAVVATHDGGGSTANASPAVAASSTPVAGLLGPDESGSPASRATAPTAGASGTPIPTGSPGGTAGHSGVPSGPPTPGRDAPGAPTPTGAPPTGAPAPPPVGRGAAALFAAAPRAQGVLKVGTTGNIMIVIRNTGDGPADNLVATVRLPAGLTAAGGSGTDLWDCTGGGPVATCIRDRLDQGEDTTLQVRVDVGVAALPGGVVAGTVRTPGGSIPIPSGTVAVLP